ENEPERRGGRHHPRRQLGWAECEHCHALELVEQHRLVEERLVVVGGRPPVTGREHLARGFRVVRLVRIPERRDAEAPEQDDERQSREENDKAQILQWPELVTLTHGKTGRNGL